MFVYGARTPVRGVLLWLHLPRGHLSGQNATYPLSHCDFRSHFHLSFLTPHDFFSNLACLSLSTSVPEEAACLAVTLADLLRKVIATASVVKTSTVGELLPIVVAC